MMEQNVSVTEAEEYLEQIPRFSKEKHTVDTVRSMLEILGNPQDAVKIIHIAGTNGKGSVCAFLSSILKKAGFSTAVFTSPHLLSTKERFSFNGQDVDDQLFLEAFCSVKDHLTIFEEAGLSHPSYFEFLFLMFMVMLKQKPVDYVVLETGLGGRLDATNAIEHPLVTIITSISLDHMEYLGDTVGKIAGEKAGIIKAGVPVVYDNTSPEASSVIREKAREMRCSAYGIDDTCYSGLTLSGKGISLEGKSADGSEAFTLDIPFSAEYQAVNSMLAVRAAELLNIRRQAVLDGVKSTFWPGRMEQIQADVYLDGAHNEGGIREFAKAAGEITALRGQGRKLLLFAVVSDKEYRDMAGILCREFAPDVLVLTQISYSRGLDIEELKRAAVEAWQEVDPLGGQHDIRVIPSVENAFEKILQEKRPEDTVFCAGSLYLIGEIKKVLWRNTHE